MTTGGPTGPAENGEASNRPTQGGTTKIDQVRKVSKYCRDLTKKPQILEKIKEYHNGRLTKTQLEEIFKRDLSGKSADFKTQIGIDEGDDAFETFLTNTKCFENQFMYEITHNTKIRESAKEEMLDGCIEILKDEYHITPSQEATVREYLKREKTPQGLNVFLESSKNRRKTLQRALPSPLTEKTLDDIDFNDLHSKIANLSPTDPNSRRIQAIWSTMLGGIRVQEGEDVTAAFRRIQEEGGEGDLTADYEAFFSCPDSLISRSNKDKIRNFLIRQYAPTISLTNLQEIDQEAAKKLLAQYQVDTHTETSPDADWESAIKSQRDESARQTRGLSLVTHAISTKNLDIKTQLRILGGLSSARRLKQKNDFARGHVGGSNIPGIDYESAFETTNGFKPDEVMTDDGLVAKLEEAHGNKIKNLDKFASGAVMRWKNKGPDRKDMIGYYVIERTLGNTLSEDGEPGDIKLRFLGNNQNGGRLSRTGIPQTKTGPQFFEYLDSCADGGEIDFISDGGTLESEELKKTLAADGASFYTDAEAKQELKSRYGSIEIQDEDALNAEIDALLYGSGNPLEAENPDNRKLCSGMTFALCKEGELDTFEIEDIVEPSDGNPGYVKIWDGWGMGEDARRELTFSEFVTQMKHLKSSYKDVYRIPFGKKGERMGHEQFNKLLKSKPHAFERKEKKNAKISIEDGKFGEYDDNGNFNQKTIVKVGDDKDLHISAIEGNIVTVSQGTFKQTDFDKDKGVFKQKPEFHGSTPHQIPLQLLWSYLQTNSCELKKEDTEPKFKKQKESDGSLGWWNIFKHSHSLGVLLHGDLWKAPFKAWEEGHHKDHAFHGKLTAALAIEKLQSSKGPIGGMLNWAEWPSLMVADSNGSFQSYLDELVNKIDGMGSYHRTRLIKKWSQEHFPSPKFMVAMFASMKIFSQLYPYDDGKDDVRKMKDGSKEWFWYNSIMHTGAVPVPEGWPKHMPPHNKDDKWPTENGQELTEIAACYRVFNTFKHPILKNLGRRFQKYMNAGHDEQLEGGKGNLDQRVTMDEKLSWMMRAVLGDKITEAFGVGTEKWLMEGYPTEISTMPYAAMLFGSREQQMVPKTQEHILKELFQGGSHVPMFAFAQSKNLGDIFRKTGVTFAYTISGSVGKELEDLVEYAAHHRIHKDSEVGGQQWQKKFEKFWRKNGAQLMHKMTGMRDPMLNLLVNDSGTFDTLMSSASPEKKKQYEKIRENKGVISAYYDRLTKTYDSPQHCVMERNKGFYSGDHFRFRKNIDVGYPMFWVNWPDYLEQLDNGFLNGTGEKNGDGLFNEVRGFIDAMPDMAKKMVEDMGITQEPERTRSIHQVCEKLYTKNVKDQIRKSMPKVGASPDAAYCSVSAMLLGMAPLKKFTFGGSDTTDHTKYVGYYERMKKIIEKAEQMEKTDFPGSIRYRTLQWKKWQQIVNDRTDLADIDATPDSAEQVVPGNRNSVIKQVTRQTLDETESVLQKPQKGPMSDNIVPFPQQPSESLRRAA